MDADGLGVDDNPALVIDIGKADIRLDRHVGLALQVVFAREGMRRFFDYGFYFVAFFTVAGVIDVRGARVDLDGVFGHGCRGIHVCRQDFQVDLDLFSRGLGVFLGVGADDGHHVAVLVDLVVVQDRAVPAVTLVGRERDETSDAVLALDILVGNDLEHARHFFCFGGVDALDDSVGNLGLHQCALQGVFGELGGHVFAEVPQAAGLGDECRARHARAVYPSVSRLLVFEG